MIIGNFTDVHARADTPEGRTDNFRLSIMKKLEEIGQIWKDNKVDLVTFTGDLFNSPDPASSVRNDVLHILKDWKLPIVGVVGSHDYVGYQMKTLKRTALGSVYYSGVMDLVGGKGQQEYIEYNINNEFVVVTGTPHTYWATDDLNYITKPRFVDNVFQMQLVHYDLMHKKVPWPHTLIADIKTESDLVMVGHYHPGWEQPIVTNNNLTMFVNQGSIGRLENTGVQRTPRVCIIHISNTLEFPTLKGFQLHYVSLETALPHPFREKLKDEKEEHSSQDVNKLIQMIESSEIDVIDIKQALPKVAKEFNYNADVLNKAFELLEKV